MLICSGEIALNLIRLWHNVWIRVDFLPCYSRAKLQFSSARQKHGVWTGPYFLGEKQDLNKLHVSRSAYFALIHCGMTYFYQKLQVVVAWKVRKTGHKSKKNLPQGMYYNNYYWKSRAVHFSYLIIWEYHCWSHCLSSLFGLMSHNLVPPW